MRIALRKLNVSRNNRRETTGECKTRRELVELLPPTRCSTKWAKESLADSISEELVQASATDSQVTISLPARVTLDSQRVVKDPWERTDQTSAELTRVSIPSNLASDRSLVLNLEIKGSVLVVHYRED